MQRVHHGHLAAVLIILGVLCLACGLGDKLKEQAAEEAFEQAIEEAGGEGDVELDVGDEIDITDLPEWLSYPDAKATGKMTMAQDGSEGTMYVLETSDAIGTVVDWYKTTMSTWEQSASFETAESTQLVYTDGSTQTVQLSHADDRYRFESTVLLSREVTRKQRLWRDIAYRTWRRNAMKELVTFAFDEDDRLIGVVEVPTDTLQDEELRVYIEALAKECDRFEYALKGWDRE